MPNEVEEESMITASRSSSLIRNAVTVLVLISAACSCDVIADAGFPEPIDIFAVGIDNVEGVPDASTLYVKYREPNVVVTRNGRIVVLCGPHKKGRRNDRAGQDIICKYSDDNGDTWSKAFLVHKAGTNSLLPTATVYDSRNNRIITLVDRILHDYRLGSQTDLNPYTKQYVTGSDDGGMTWSALRDITDMMPPAQHTVVVFGSGEGIQLQRGAYKGRLIIPGGDHRGRRFVYAFYSDDGGETWKYGESAPYPDDMGRRNRLSCETAMAELSDGTVLLNSRSTAGYRYRAWSCDGGQTWTRMELDMQLPSVGCNSGLITVRDPKDRDKSLVIYAGPVGPDPAKGQTGTSRQNGTVFVSFDGGKTWPTRRLAVPDSFGYSSLAQLKDGRVALIYETHEAGSDNPWSKISVVRFTIDWLTH